MTYLCLISVGLKLKSPEKVNESPVPYNRSKLENMMDLIIQKQTEITMTADAFNAKLRERNMKDAAFLAQQIRLRERCMYCDEKLPDEHVMIDYYRRYCADLCRQLDEAEHPSRSESKNSSISDI